MSRSQLILMVACLALITTGCRNRCNNYGNWLACNPTIAPPPTYGINIPSVARNQAPYYTPGSAPTHNVNPNGQAPTAAGQPVQNGWRRSAVNGGTNTARPGNGNSVLTTPTTFVEAAPRSQNPRNGGMNSVLAGGSTNPNATTASMAALPGTGVSTTNSQNYNSTQVDERLDATRLAVTDASQVRAPSRNFPTGAIAPVAYPAGYYAPLGVQQTYAGQVGFYRQTAPAYSGQPVLLPAQSNPVGYSGQPVLLGPGAGFQRGFPTSSQPTVLAQATTVTSSQPSSQLGWQSRELSSDRTGRF